MYMGIVVYAPSLALATVTGLDYHASVLSGLPTNPDLFCYALSGQVTGFFERSFNFLHTDVRPDTPLR